MRTYWTFDNPADPTADVYAGYDGVNGGATWIPNGLVDGAMHFDGINDQVDVTDPALNVPTWDSYTIAVWFRNDGGGDLTNGYGQKIIDKTTFFSYFYLSVHSHSDGHLVFFTYDDGAASLLDLDHDYRDNQWHHAVVVKSGEYGELWVDGDLKDTADDLKSPDNGQPLLMGYSISDDAFQRKHWSGDLDEFAIFDRILSEAEIEELYATTLKGNHYCDVGDGGGDDGLEIDIERDLTIDGDAANDELGYSVANGDVNNDGVPDLIMGAPHVGFDQGAAYVFFGPVTDDLDAADADVTINGAADGDFAGSSVGVGDINNDGVNDLIVGAQKADPVGQDEAGKVYVLFGPLAPGGYGIAGEADVVVFGAEAGDEAGTGVSGADVNDDGADDLVIGAHLVDGPGQPDSGRVYILYGPVTESHDLATGAGTTINGVDGNDRIGNLGSGDLNDDDAADLVIGALGGDPKGSNDAGETYVVYGPLAEGVFDLEDIASLIIEGVDSGDEAGHPAAGDVNGDGVDDVMIGAEFADSQGRFDNGEVHVVYGPLPAKGALELATDADVTYLGIDTGDKLSRVAAGDVNDDGLGDLIMGAPEAGTLVVGEAYVVFGPIAGAPCPWDMDEDGNVGTGDLILLLGAWGTDPDGPPDFDGDGNVGTSDLIELLGAWGPCPK